MGTMQFIQTGRKFLGYIIHLIITDDYWKYGFIYEESILCFFNLFLQMKVKKNKKRNKRNKSIKIFRKWIWNKKKEVLYNNNEKNNKDINNNINNDINNDKNNNIKEKEYKIETNIIKSDININIKSKNEDENNEKNEKKFFESCNHIEKIKNNNNIFKKDDSNLSTLKSTPKKYKSDTKLVKVKGPILMALEKFSSKKNIMNVRRKSNNYK